MAARTFQCMDWSYAQGPLLVEQHFAPVQRATTRNGVWGAVLRPMTPGWSQARTGRSQSPLGVVHSPDRSKAPCQGGSQAASYTPGFMQPTASSGAPTNTHAPMHHETTDRPATPFLGASQPASYTPGFVPAAVGSRAPVSARTPNHHPYHIGAPLPAFDRSEPAESSNGCNFQFGSRPVQAFASPLRARSPQPCSGSPVVRFVPQAAIPYGQQLAPPVPMQGVSTTACCSSSSSPLRSRFGGSGSAQQANPCHIGRVYGEISPDSTIISHHASPHRAISTRCHVSPERARDLPTRTASASSDAVHNFSPKRVLGSPVRSLPVTVTVATVAPGGTPHRMPSQPRVVAAPNVLQHQPLQPTVVPQPETTAKSRRISAESLALAVQIARAAQAGVPSAWHTQNSSAESTWPASASIGVATVSSLDAVRTATQSHNDSQFWPRAVNEATQPTNPGVVPHQVTVDEAQEIASSSVFVPRITPGSAGLDNAPRDFACQVYGNEDICIEKPAPTVHAEQVLGFMKPPEEHPVGTGSVASVGDFSEPGPEPTQEQPCPEPMDNSVTPEVTPFPTLEPLQANVQPQRSPRFLFGQGLELSLERLHSAGSPITPCRGSLAYSSDGGTTPNSGTPFYYGEGTLPGTLPVSPLSPLLTPMDRMSCATSLRESLAPFAPPAPAGAVVQEYMRRSIGSEWKYRYRDEFGHFPATPEHLCAYAANRGGKVTWSEARSAMN